ncbi:uncharacterized protein LOC122499689 [Leptopilina heterotoma]|uniref:uncharacterized protein LOC122499689 n=1 Tax=Leptopilina heterotoma TaxID=63436 RepID=UPI001CA8ED53|nr:uncharacterized protein LOC122499689 [Leptopilina heterotoma]XP_043464099.1 uncharacterized protein LOC122499689 [Leptopilina heterotoma]XP_043464102.1 uncharacterized protein LOC122499689 [Leptopilina heterotoma]
MHDGPEGIINYTLSKIVDGLIADKLITLDLLNKKIETFPYNDLEKQNKPRLLYYSVGKKGGRKIKIKQSASEITCLTRYLGLMIGDLIPADNRYWKLYICLREIVDILMSPIIDKGQIQILNILIMKHNMQYLKLFGKLKPKMHIWLHYPRLIMLNGPVVHYSSMKFERKNKEAKEYALGTTSNVNLPLTIAIRHQLKMCYTLQFCPPILGDMVLGPIVNTSAQNHLKNLIPNLSSNVKVMTLKNVEILGSNFSEGTVFVTRIAENGPQFGMLKTVFYVNDKTIYFETSEFKTIYFNHQYHAYNVQSDPSKSNLLINAELIPRITPCLLCTKKGNEFVATRYKL